MNGYLIALIILFVTSVFFIGLFIVNLVFIWMFSIMLKRHEKALTILLAQKYDLIEQLLQIYTKNSIEVTDEILSCFQHIDVTHFEKLDTPSSYQARQDLSILKQDILAIVKNNETFQKNEEFKMCEESINSLDIQFRNVAAAYNADVIGYNYWVRFRVFRYLFLYNHVGLKDIIF